MSHLLSETARATHCVPRCKSLMRLKHLEMLELPFKRSSMQCCLGREMDDSVEIKRYIYLRTIAEHKVYAEFDFPALPLN